ncbi:Clan CA, family C19, ubiquitin hydrolase-like cysteine peptidase [Tritrichomonas foetus]|uniref:Clan CA, family C19, ubiquitin hydrolase-like cysteine peptidase n=1 Tax=Tritrichomonas foetus TaxID=1144522 RepID=A0A1J4KSZ2_9EUKA|nr:Clan CA, family C19, ubiquitin hydrolase-like cysteine peptidase [Tritrichomonas foetus]|eukprot:OHT12908.1 Clan CA, family C19, ubiquitin hydrolase-like cysteine peptidase [Tritrichomonas foetus]
MSHNIEFPQNDDFIFEGDDISDNVRNLSNVLSQLNSIPMDEFPPKTDDFLNNQLPSIWRTIQSSSHPSRSLIKEITFFEEQYCKLCVHTNLIPSMLIAITTTFDSSLQKGTFYQCETISDQERDSIFDKLENHDKILRPDRPNSNHITKELILNVVKSCIFKRAKELYEENILNAEQVSALVRLFTCIESSIDPKLVSAILPILMNASIRLIDPKNTDLNHICQFLSKFVVMMPNLVDSILNVFCDLSSEKSPVTTRYMAISDIITIVSSVGIGNSENQVKNAMVNALNTSSQSNILTRVYQFLPKLASITQFSDDDLHSLLNKTRSNDEKLISALVEVINSINRSVDSFAEELLAHDILSPALYCSVIGKTESETTTKRLFDQLLDSTDRLMKKTSIQHVELNDRLTSLMNEEGVDLMKLLKFLFLCAPNVDTLKDSIVKVLNLPVLPPELIPMLQGFTRKLNDFDSSTTIMALFNVVLGKLQTTTSYNQFTSSLVTVVTQWINVSNNIETTVILKKLSELNFTSIDDSVPCLVNELIAKCNDEKVKQDFLFKVLNDSVPPKHSIWLIESLFTLIHEDNNLVLTCFNTIMEHIQGDKYTNGVSLLYSAVMYEADFYQLGEHNCFNQNVVLHLQDDNATDIVISLHPFHSTRRIFAEVAHALNISVTQFQLIITEEQQEKYLTYNAPLNVVQIGIIEEEDLVYHEVPMELIIASNNEDHQPNPPTYETPFMDCLASKTSILFDLLKDDFESELLFLIILLFPKLSLVPNNPLQEVAVGKCSDPMLFKDSIRVFPYAVSCSPIPERAQEFLFELVSHNYDTVSVAFACKALFGIENTFVFDKTNLKKCLIDCSNHQFRSITSKMVSTETNKDDMIELLMTTLTKENRKKSKQFYDCIKKFNLPPETFIPIYQALEQFEFSYYSDIDQTFISLLDLIPENQEMIDLTIQRLFSPPTCKNETLPFVHTIESWLAALKFIESEFAISRINCLVSELKEIPTAAELSSDYTYKGRCGIYNMGSTCYMNALMQVLNGFQHFSLKIISKNTKDLPQFVVEMRNCLAKLRYIRGVDLQLNKLANTIDENFNPFLQQDIEEFFNLRIVNRLSEELKEADDVTETMKIQVTYNISTDSGQIVSTHKETLYYFLLQTKNLSRIDESFKLYFEPENIEYTIEGTKEKVPAKRWISISKWPDYLVVQLQRWEFSIETGERHKLVHEFGFPVDLRDDDIKCHFEAQKCDCAYTLAGVVIHQGNADQGHYFAIVLGDDNEWYFCNDRKIEYFDINDLATFAYGISDGNQSPEEIYTGYLLFYKKVGLPKISVECPQDLEEEIDAENARNWSSVIFYSHEFVDYAKRMIMEYNKNIEMLDIALSVLFKIAICEESSLRQWCFILTNHVLTEKSQCLRFFEYVEKEINTSLAALFAISENVTNELTTLFSFVFSKLIDTTKPLISILKCVEGQFPKRMFCTFLFDTIANLCQLLKVEWVQEEEALTLMLTILSLQLAKETQRQVTKSHVTAFNNLLSVFTDVIRIKGCTDAVLSVFDIQRMNKIGHIYKKCENFSKLLLYVNSIRQDIFLDTEEASPATLELINQFIPQQQAADNTETLDLDLDFMFPSLEQLVFCENKEVRRNSCDVLIQMIGKKDENLILFLKEAIINETLQCHLLPEENSVTLFVCGLLPKMHELIHHGDESSCKEFIEVVLRLCCVHPNSLIREFLIISEIYLSIQNEKLKRKIFKIIHHLIAYDRSLLSDSSLEKVFDNIMSSYVTSKYTTQILAAFQDKANNTTLSGACIEYYLTSEYDENAEILLNLLQKGLHPAEVNIPSSADCFMQLKFANELWNIWPEKKSELANFMLSAFKHAKPFSLYQNSVTLKQTIEHLKSYCPDDVSKVIDEMSENKNPKS